jgi:hypothetical protein
MSSVSPIRYLRTHNSRINSIQVGPIREDIAGYRVCLRIVSAQDSYIGNITRVYQKVSGLNQ